MNIFRGYLSKLGDPLSLLILSNVMLLPFVLTVTSVNKFVIIHGHNMKQIDRYKYQNLF